MSGKFSSGFDEVPSNMLKPCKDHISKPLVNIINKFFQQGSFQAGLKTSKVMLVQKKNETDLVSNYR